ncbi:surface-adhesin E family protein [Geminicoccus roseus]|uniref:surface-adhesin E family protein n=1 Tax=Geminicoccus roseus TaxID=404900 RepID=UPI00041E01A6|nr:surface-adhesin E family protein [Geminicoccus roseus]
MRWLALLAIVLLTLAPPALAARWEAVGLTAKGNQVFIDASKMKKATGDVRTISYRVLYTPPLDLDGRTIASARFDARFDCPSGMVTTDKITLYTDPESTRTLAQKRERVPMTVKEPPGSSGDIARQAVCR